MTTSLKDEVSRVTGIFGASACGLGLLSTAFVVAIIYADALPAVLLVILPVVALGSILLAAAFSDFVDRLGVPKPRQVP